MSGPSDTRTSMNKINRRVLKKPTKSVYASKIAISQQRTHLYSSWRDARHECLPWYGKLLGCTVETQDGKAGKFSAWVLLIAGWDWNVVRAAQMEGNREMDEFAEYLKFLGFLETWKPTKICSLQNWDWCLWWARPAKRKRSQRKRICTVHLIKYDQLSSQLIDLVETLIRA